MSTTHLVMFRVSRTLSDEDREAFVHAFEQALTGIPTIRDAKVGRRVHLGAAYDTGMESYDYMATLDFDSDADLRAYLEHPVHQELGARFFGAVEAALVYDFHTVPGARLRELID